MLETITSESTRRELLELAGKYEWPGPRYTTYPTASHFRESFGPANYELALAKLKTRGTKDLSLYVHLPFCQRPHPCDPHEHVAQRAGKTTRYIEQVKREADLLAHRIAAGRQVVSMHWGGAPTSLPPTLLEDLAAHLRRRFTYATDAEISIEADPGELAEEHLAAARQGGLNRISFGAQTLAPVAEKAIEPLEVLERATQLAREAGTLRCDFQGYSTHRSAAALGLGLGALSQTTGAYVQNEQDLRRYYAALGARRLPTYRGYWLSSDDRLRRHVIIRLLCDSALDIRSIEDEFGIRFRDYFADALEALAPLEADGLVKVRPERIEATPAGRLFIRNLVRPFDCHLCPQTVHSRTVWIEP